MAGPITGQVLAPKSARLLKAMAIESVLSGARLAEVFGVSKSTVSAVRTGKNWAHLKVYTYIEAGALP